MIFASRFKFVRASINCCDIKTTLHKSTHDSLSFKTYSEMRVSLKLVCRQDLKVCVSKRNLMMALNRLAG